MAMLEPRLILLRLIELTVLSILFGIGASWCWALWNLLTGQRLLPERPLVARRKTPWSSGSVLLVFILYVVVNLVLFKGYERLTRGSPSEEIPVAAQPASVEAEEKPAPQASGPADVRSAQGDHPMEPEPPTAMPELPGVPRKNSSDVSLLELMSIQAVVNTILLALLPLVLRGTSGARLGDLGLSRAHWGRQVTIGIVAILYLLPLILGTQYLAVKLMGSFSEQSRHPVERMLREQFSGGVAALALFTAVVLAPMFEELMFRGIFQSWLISLLERSRHALKSRLFEPRPSRETPSLMGESGRWTPDLEDRESAQPADQMNAAPDGRFTQGDSAGSPEPLECWLADDSDAVPPESKDSPTDVLSPTSVWAAIILTSLVFASLHSSQWPAPIPIFILAMGLGLVYHRTGSLIAVICMHAVFNASSTLALIYSLMIGVPGVGETKVPPPAVGRDAHLEKVKPGGFDVDRRSD